MIQNRRISNFREPIENSKNKRIIISMAIISFLLILTFTVSLILYSNPFSQFLPRHDSSMFQYFGYAMDNGKTIYTEIFDHKGPMIFIINYFGILLATQNIQGIYFLEFASLFVYFLFTYKTMHLWLNKLLSLTLVIPHGILLMFYLENGNLTEEFALPFISVSLYIFSKYFKEGIDISYFEIIFLGIASAITFSLRANMVVIWLAFCFVIFFKVIIEKEYKTLLNYTFLFMGGLLLFFIPMGAYLYFNGALKEAIFQSLTFNFMYLDTTGDSSEAIMRLYKMLYNDFIIFVFSAFLIYVASQWKKLNINERYFFTGVILFSIGSFITSILSGRAYAHYLMVMIPTLTAPSAILMREISKGKSKIFILIATLLIIGISYYSQIQQRFEDIYVTNIPIDSVKRDEVEIKEEKSENIRLIELYKRVNDNDYEKQQIYDISEVIIENTQLSDKIYAHRLAGNIYLQSNRLSSIKYFNLPAVDINENLLVGDDFLSEFLKSDTKLVILNENFHSADKTGVEERFFSYIKENYELIYDQNSHYIYILKTS